ncbi:MAG TPA: hypothetical protein VEX68_28900 [Bryobacteraceae bacterium]|nr:hypothetical protein [Bryobacteraceae bacterium]
MLRFFLVFASYFSRPDELPQCVQYWQRELGLEDWKITTQVVGRQELQSGTIGDIEPDIQTKTAAMRILRESDSDLHGRLARAEQRNTIAHEMVHLLNYAKGNPNWRTEGATNMQTARLIVKHRRWFEMLALEQ